MTLKTTFSTSIDTTANQLSEVPRVTAQLACTTLINILQVPKVCLKPAF